MKAIAMLDAIICPEWEFRYFSFDQHWAPGQMMGSFRNGSGSYYHMLFKEEGAVLVGQTPRSEMAERKRRKEAGGPETWKATEGLFDGVPEVFADALTEPAFSIPFVTFCLWRLKSDDSWTAQTCNASASENLSEEILFCLDGSPETYQEWAMDYYQPDEDMEYPLNVVENIYQGQSLTDEMIAALNPDLTLQDLGAEIEEIGYGLGH